MDISGIIQIIIIALLIAISAFFSSAETAFTTVNKIKIRALSDEGNKKARAVSKILENPGRMLSSILVGNNIVNIGVSSLTTAFTINYFGAAATGIGTVILTVILLIIGEITPKTLASKNAEKISMNYASSINVIIVILTPVVFVIDKLSKLILKLFKSDSAGDTSTITEAELRVLVNVGHEEGVFESDEKLIINKLFDFGDSIVKDAMVQRIDMILIDVNSSFDDVMEVFKDSRHSRIPVYQGNTENIIGVLYSKDVLLSGPFTEPSQKNSFDITRIMRKPYFTYETKNASVLFKDMQENFTSSAIVIDEYGDVAGFVTTQDLIEEIFGNIKDEYDPSESEPFVELAPGKYRVEGSYKLDDINYALGSNLKSEDNDSIGGFIIEHLDRLPRAGDTIETDGLKATVMRVNNKRIEAVILEKI